MTLRERFDAGEGRMCSCLTLDYFEQDSWWRAVFGPDHAVIKAYRAKGYTYWPSCDNIRADGHCAGHPREKP